MKISCQEHRQDIAALYELRVFVITYLSYTITLPKNHSCILQHLNPSASCSVKSVPIFAFHCSIM